MARFERAAKSLKLRDLVVHSDSLARGAVPLQIGTALTDWSWYAMSNAEPEQEFPDV